MSAPLPQTITHLSAIDLSYLAGYLEGEGSFCCCRHGNKLYPTICAETRDIEPLQKLQRMCGGFINGPLRTRKPHHTPTFRWALTRRLDCAALARWLRPRMSPRRQTQIDTLLATI